MPLFSILALWVILITIARNLLGTAYLSVPYIELVILVTSVAVHAPLLRSAAQGLRLPSPRIWTWLPAIVAAALVYGAVGAYYSDYLGFHWLQAETGLFGTRNADFSLHLGIANALVHHATLVENPLYIGGTLAGLPIFDLMVASISRLAFIDVSAAFYVVSPLLVMCLWLALPFHFWGKGNAVFGFTVIAAFWLAYVDANTAVYNALAAAYCLALAMFGVRLGERLCRQDEISTRAFVGSLAILLGLSLFASQNKFLMWAPVAGALSATFGAMMLLRWRTLTARRKMLLVMAATASVLPAISLLERGQSSAAGYYALGWSLSLPSSFYTASAILCGFALLAFLFPVSGRKEGSLVVIATTALGLTVATVLIPVQYEGGASVFYPIVSVKILMLVAPLLLWQGSSSLWREGVRLLALVAITLSLGVKLTSDTPLWNGRHLERNLTGPDRGAREALAVLNAHAEPGDGVVTNYASLDRFYSFSEFLNVTPFLSSDKYASVGLQADFVERTSIQDRLFLDGDLPGFLAALKQGYPRVKYLFIDSTLPFNGSPPAESNLAWGNFMPIIFDPTTLQQAAGRITRAGTDIAITYPAGAPEGFTVKARDIAAMLDAGVASGQLEVIFENGSARVYALHPE